VVISGIGAVGGFGIGADVMWESLLEGRSTIAPIRRFDGSGFECAQASEVPDDFKIRDFVPKTYRKATKVMARDIELAVAAAKLAIEDAGLITKANAEDGAAPTHAPGRVGCHIGAGLIAAEVPELAMAMASASTADGGLDYGAWGEHGMQNLTPLWLLKYLPNMLACHVTIVHGAEGPSNTITCSEASGLLSLGESRNVIERGHADACFSGGAESKVNPMGLVRWRLARRLGVVAPDDDGASVVRPYDADASGTVLGEAGGIVIAEAREVAERRGARIYAEVSGFGAGQSPASDTIEERAEGLRFAIERALQDAGIGAESIDAIVPHASGAPLSDDEEAAALRAVFGARLSEVPLMTTAPNFGDMTAGFGGVQVCVGCLALRHQTLPARLHSGTCPPDLRAEATDSSDAKLRHVLLCTGAVGGQNAAIVLSGA
jgi:3-oxoacyl-[acyl-carrier-protein] synthase II